jgi:hypothetical protein
MNGVGFAAPLIDTHSHSQEKHEKHEMWKVLVFVGEYQAIEAKRLELKDSGVLVVNPGGRREVWLAPGSWVKVTTDPGIEPNTLQDAKEALNVRYEKAS